MDLLDLSDTSMPEMWAAPATSAPDVPAPHVSAPHVSAPDPSVPGLRAPDGSVPDPAWGARSHTGGDTVETDGTWWQAMMTETAPAHLPAAGSGTPDAGVADVPACDPDAERHAVSQLLSDPRLTYRQGYEANAKVENLLRGSYWMPWLTWERSPYLAGLFPKVLALAAVPWRRVQTSGAQEYFAWRQALGHDVIGGLWRTIEAEMLTESAAGSGLSVGWAAPQSRQIAERVATAVTAQASSTSGVTGAYLGVGAELTAELALAFIDQTLAAADPQAAAVQDAHRAAQKTMLSYRRGKVLESGRRMAWEHVLAQFVTQVNGHIDATGQDVWTQLRDHVQTPLPDGARRVRPRTAVAKPGYDEALEVLGDASFGDKEHRIVRVQLRDLFTRGDPVGWPAWEVRPGLREVFPSVLVLSVLRWPDPNKQDSPELVTAREELGRRVVGALWRAVEADAEDAGDVAGVARQVAVAVTAQAPGDPERYSGVDRTLTAGVARAFIDQTLAAVKEAVRREAAGREAAGQDAPVVKSVKSLHQKTAGTMVSFRQSGSRDGPKRVSWRTLLSDFVTRAEAADRQVWWHLRHRLLGDVDGLPAPVPRSAGLQDASVGVTRQLPSVEQEGHLARWALIRELPTEGSGQFSARQALKAWLERGGVVPWPGWQERPQRMGTFRSVLVLSVLRWPDPKKQDPPELVDLRDRLGRQVVGALWRMVEAGTADTADTPDAAEIARQVAVAVTTQAPTVHDDPARYAGIGAVLCRRS
jgi:hypothetical protein